MLKISTHKPKAQQLELFDRLALQSLWKDKVLNHGLVRTLIGDYYEKRTATHFQGSIHKTDCRCDYCPDISYGDPIQYLEVKACGNSNSVLIYEGRLLKDLQISKELSLTISYCVWKHSVETKTHNTARELIDALTQQTLAMYLIPLQSIKEICNKLPVIKLNSKYGSSDSNPTYGSGYRIPIKKLNQFISQEPKKWH